MEAQILIEADLNFILDTHGTVFTFMVLPFDYHYKIYKLYRILISRPITWVYTFPVNAKHTNKLGRLAWVTFLWKAGLIIKMSSKSPTDFLLKNDYSCICVGAAGWLRAIGEWWQVRLIFANHFLHHVYLSWELVVVWGGKTIYCTTHGFTSPQPESWLLLPSGSSCRHSGMSSNTLPSDIC